MNIFRGPVELKDTNFPCIVLIPVDGIWLAKDKSLGSFRVDAYQYMTPPRRYAHFPVPTRHQVTAKTMEEAVGIVESTYIRGQTYFRATKSP